MHHDDDAIGDHPGSPRHIRELISRGEYLAAYDAAAARIDAGERDPETRFLGVLALARSGATEQARRRYREYGLDVIDTGSMPRALADDIAVLDARLDKDTAASRPGHISARRSAGSYETAFDRSGSAYHAVNAATMWLLAGEPERARGLARRALDDADRQGDPYWDAATEAEAALVVGDIARAEQSIAEARAQGEGRYSERATTIGQLEMVCSLTGADPAVLRPLQNPSVIHYCGHLMLPNGGQGRFTADDERRVAGDLTAALDRLDVGFAYGSLAAGADIIAAEAVVARGGRLHVVLPFPEQEFVRTSVLPAGSEWVGRFERCLAASTTIETATDGDDLGDPVLFDFCSRIAMGDALLRSTQLRADAHQIAVWDEQPTTATAGTARDVERWRLAGGSSTVIPIDRAATPPVDERPAHPRTVRGILFADYAGFSRLSEGQMVRFQERVLTRVGAALRSYGAHVLSSRTWGDGINLVFDEVGAAADCALDLVGISRPEDLESAGLPQLRGIRIAAHAAPVFEGVDPVSGHTQFYGVGMTQAARIEPRTPEGEIYTTHAFAALAVLEQPGVFECQYVGNVPTAKEYGTMPLYALRRRPLPT